MSSRVPPRAAAPLPAALSLGAPLLGALFLDALLRAGLRRCGAPSPWGALPRVNVVNSLPPLRACRNPSQLQLATMAIAAVQAEQRKLAVCECRAYPHKPGGPAVVGHVTAHHRAGRDNHVAPDPCAGQHDRSRAKPRPGTDRNRLVNWRLP